MEYKVEYKKKTNKTWKMWDIVGVPVTDIESQVIDIITTTIDLSNTPEWKDKNYEWQAIKPDGKELTIR